MTEEKKDSKSKVIIIILIVVIVLLLSAGAVVTVMLLQNDNAGKTAETDQNFVEPPVTSVVSDNKDNGAPVLEYDNSAVALNADDLAKQYSELQDKANEGNVSLEFQNIAFSDNGTDFTCYLANSSSNTEDMYFDIYTDGTFAEQIYLSGLLPPGKVIESFHSEKRLDSGKHEVVVLFTTVADDHKTITSQTPVVITLEVG